MVPKLRLCWHRLAYALAGQPWPLPCQNIVKAFVVSLFKALMLLCVHA